MTKEPLHKMFQRMSGGNPEVRAIIIEIAKTARAIDLECPLGPYGVLEDLDMFQLTPDELLKLYKFCDSNVLLMNAIAFWGFKKLMSSSDLKMAIANDFADFLSHNEILQTVLKLQPSFGVNYRPGSGSGR